VAVAGNNLKVLIAGGGTGGHVIPALAIARELRDAHSAEVRFVGTARGLETRLVPEAGFPLELIHVGQLKNVSLATRLKTLGDLPRGIAKCLSLLGTFQPDVVVGVGGYASGPAMLAALLRRVPTLAFEPNAAPGLANRLIGRFVSAAAVNFPETAHQFRNARVTGIPVRPEFFAIAPHTAGGAQRLLVMGGSQGARALNEAMPKIAKALLDAVPLLTIEHQCGARHVQATEDAYAQSGADARRFLVSGFLSNAAEAIAEADLLLCRSGASTVAELCAAGRPALYVPFPQAADDHQRRNAEVMVAAGAADLLPEREMLPDTLLKRLLVLLQDADRLAEMGMRARSVARPDAVIDIAEMVHNLRGK
jgi:UDP-N-acetylglucosamine--N-acetylmuramyl-(pentapeptide) pyrophosphoryl-undecaprenol N-acetylglucosamine transferase